MTGVNVLVIVGSRAKSVDDALALLAAESASNGTTVNVFDTLGELPPYSETLEADRTPDSVVALRAAATEADAALVVTNYHGRVPTMVHNAIDWLTLRWNQSALHDKPLAVIGRADGCYSGVWSHHQTHDGRRMAQPRVVEPITVATLHEAVDKLAGEANESSEPSWAAPAFDRMR